MSVKLLILGTTISLIQSCATYKGNNSYQVKKNLSYTEIKNDVRLQGDLYQVKKQNAPLVILVHGGGWSGRDKDDMNHIAKSLATNGFNVFNINYQLAPKYKHPTPIKNLADAIDFMKRKYNFTSENIALWGYSSGGHIVSYYALKNPTKIRYVVSGGAPYDLNWYPKSPIIIKYLGKYRDELPCEYFEASPVNHIHKDAPPFHLYHAKQDILVEHSQSASFQDKLRRKGGKASLHSIDWWGHATAFIFSKEAIKISIQKLKENFQI